MGATATLALAGKALSVNANRGPADFEGHPGFITVHPSSLLRMKDDADRRAAFRRFAADLKRAKKMAAEEAVEDGRKS
jgi:DNA polymerase